jgi:hypothetical protein
LSQTPQFPQHFLEALALDELHGVIVNAVVSADVVDRDDVGVVQPRRRTGLAAEALQADEVRRRLGRQHLQGDVAAQRLLLRFVNDAHAAAAHLAQDAVVTEPFGYPGSSRPSAEAGRLVVLARAGFLHHHQGGKEVADVIRQVGAAADELAQRGPFSPAKARQELFGQLVDRVADGFIAGHQMSPPPALGWTGSF